MFGPRGFYILLIISLIGS